MMGAVAEAAVRAARNSLCMVGVVGILIAYAFVQVLHKLGGAVIEPVNITGISVIVRAHVAVDSAASFADGLCPVEARIVGVHAGGAVIDAALALAVSHSAV